MNRFLVLVVQFMILSTLFTVHVADASRGSVKHSNKKNARATTAHRPAATPGNRQSARAGYRAGSRHGYSRGYSHGRHHGGRYHAWDQARRDYYRWRTVTGLVKLGVYYSSKPQQSTTVVVTGSTYYYYNGVYYVSSGSGYVVTSAPPGAVVYSVPTHTTVVYVGTTPYYYVNGVYYVATDAPAQQPPPPPPPPSSSSSTQTSQQTARDGESNDTSSNASSIDPAVAEAEAALAEVEMLEEDYNYEVVTPPAGATVPYLPDEAKKEKINGSTYYLHEGAYYKPFANDGETIYMVVEDPNSN